MGSVNILTSNNTVILQANITVEWFANNLSHWIKLLNGVDYARYKAIKSQRKQLQLLLGRVLIHHGFFCLTKINISSYHIENYCKLVVSNVDTSLYLSIAHCQDDVLLVLTNVKAKIGIDIEQTSHRDFKGLSEEYFNPREISKLAESNFSNEAFYRLWTAKEALTKTVSGTLSNLIAVDCSVVVTSNQTQLHFNEQAFNYYYWAFDSYICALICDKSLVNFKTIYTSINGRDLIHIGL